MRGMGMMTMAMRTTAMRTLPGVMVESSTQACLGSTGGKGLAQAPSALRAISIMGWRMAKLPLATHKLQA